MKSKLIFMNYKLLKNILTATIIILVLCENSFSQSTTQEEYNYITKGYKIQVESGLDMKKGYILTELGNSGLIMVMKEE